MRGAMQAFSVYSERGRHAYRFDSGLRRRSRYVCNPCRRAVVGGFSDETAAKGHQLIDRAAKTCLVLRDFR